MRCSELSFLTCFLSAVWYFFLDAYRGSMSVARLVRSALSLGATRNALVVIFMMIPSVLVPAAVGNALVETTGLGGAGCQPRVVGALGKSYPALGHRR